MIRGRVVPAADRGAQRSVRLDTRGSIDLYRVPCRPHRGAGNGERNTPGGEVVEARRMPIAARAMILGAILAPVLGSQLTLAGDPWALTASTDRAVRQVPATTATVAAGSGGRSMRLAP